MYKNICVFCGANEGKLIDCTDEIRKLVRLFVSKKYRLIYGGGSKGLMGSLANMMLEEGGEVYGVIPEKLVEFETAHYEITKLEIVPDMHTRKSRMASLAEGFIALPGGLGTLEELFEVWTWNLLGYHAKAIAVLNIEGYYQKLLDFLNHSIMCGFINKESIDDLIIEQEPELLMKRFANFKPNNKKRWD